MQSPFDPQDLIERLKGQGLDLTESAAKLLAVSVLDWASDSVVLTPNKYDDFVLAVMPVIRSFVLREIDRIDGKED